MIKKSKRKFDFDSFVFTGQILDSNDLYPVSDISFSSFKILNLCEKDIYSPLTRRKNGYPEVYFGPSCPGLATKTMKHGGDIISIGFDFNINGIIYKKIYVNTNGWCVLIDPQIEDGDFDPSLIVGNDPSKNTNIQSYFGAQHILLSVWFDSLTNSFKKPSNKIINTDNEDDIFIPDDLKDTNFFNASNDSKNILSRVINITTKDRENALNIIDKINSEDKVIIKGFTKLKSKIFKDYSSGVRYYSGTDKSGEQIKIIRWSSFLPIKNSQGNKMFQSADSLVNILDFELIIFSSGEIQYRYSSQRIIDLNLDASEPIIGVFLGGKETFKNFVEYKGLSGKTNLILSKGYLFKFFPDEMNTPINKSFLKQTGSKQIVSEGLFNDQKTFVFDDQQSVEYPSMIPSNSIESNDPHISSLGRNMSHKNGIRFKRSLSAGLMESVLEIHESEERKTK